MSQKMLSLCDGLRWFIIAMDSGEQESERQRMAHKLLSELRKEIQPDDNEDFIYVNEYADGALSVHETESEAMEFKTTTAPIIRARRYRTG